MIDDITDKEHVDNREQHKHLVEVLLQKREAIKLEQKELNLETLKVQQELNKQLEQLQTRRQLLENGLQHVEALLGLEGWGGKQKLAVDLAQNDRASPADAAFELLKKVGEPIHYKDIASRLSEKGINLTGKNPQATLLSYLARDERFKRAAQRGVYGLSEWKFKGAKRRHRKKMKARKYPHV